MQSDAWSNSGPICKFILRATLRNRQKRTELGFSKIPLSKGGCWICCSGYVHLNQPSAERAKIRYVLWFLRDTSFTNMIEYDLCGIMSTTPHTKLEYLHTAFPCSIRPSRNVSDVMDLIAIRSRFRYDSLGWSGESRDTISHIICRPGGWPVG